MMLISYVEYSNFLYREKETNVYQNLFTQVEKYNMVILGRHYILME